MTRAACAIALCALVVACSESPAASGSGGSGVGSAGDGSGGAGSGGDGGVAGLPAGGQDAGGSGPKSPFDGPKSTSVAALDGARVYTLTSVNHEDGFLSILNVDESGGLELKSTLLTPRNPAAIVPHGYQLLLFFDADQPLWEGMPRPDVRNDTLIWVVDVSDPANPQQHSAVTVSGLYAGSFEANGGYYVVSRVVGAGAAPATTSITSLGLTDSQLVVRDFFRASDPTGHWTLPHFDFDERHLVVSDWSDERFDGFRQLDLLPDGSIAGRGVGHFRGDLELSAQLRLSGDQLTAVSLPKSGGASLESFNLTDTGPERLSEVSVAGEPVARVAAARVDDTLAFIGGDTTLFAARAGGSWQAAELPATPFQIAPLGGDWLIAGHSYSPNQISLSRVSFDGNALTSQLDLWVPPEPSSTYAGALAVESSGLVVLPYSTNASGNPPSALNVYDSSGASLSFRGELALEGFVSKVFLHGNNVLLVSDGFVTSVSIDDPGAPRLIARQRLF